MYTNFVSIMQRKFQQRIYDGRRVLPKMRNFEVGFSNANKKNLFLNNTISKIESRFKNQMILLNLIFVAALYGRKVESPFLPKHYDKWKTKFPILNISNVSFIACIVF